MSRSQQLDMEIARQQQRKRSNRQREKVLRGRYAQMGMQPPVGYNQTAALRQQMSDSLPDYMMPGNIGQINQVTWTFYFNLTFDFGANPIWGPGLTQTQSFQVDQEACFLMMGITRSSSAYNTAGELAPLQLEMKDRQSSRVFDNSPIPIQAYGTMSNLTVLPTPFLLMPNAFFDVTLTSMQTQTQGTISATSQQHFSFFGYRMRVQDAQAVLSTIFGGN
jgi:hypothetical protein